MTIDPSRYTRSLRARRLRGAAALLEVLTLIGATNADDHDLARVVVDNEMELREFLDGALKELVRPDYDDRRRPTVEELDAILNDPAPRHVVVQPDGSVRSE